MNVFPDPVTDRDFPEDFEQENGCYQNKCCLCGEMFKGNKHRVTCKLCNNVKMPKTTKPVKTHKAQLNQQAERLIKLSFNVEPEIKTELVEIAVILEMTGDKIENENKESGIALQGIRDILKEIKP